MWEAIGLVVLALFIVSVLAKLKKGSSTSKDSWPVFARAALSEVEQVMFHRLVRAFPESIVLAQVSIAQFIRVKKGANFHQVFNRFNRLTADYILCAKDFKVIAAIELDDRSHERPDRIKADQRKAAVLAAAGIALHRVKVNRMLNESELRKLIASPAPDWD